MAVTKIKPIKGTLNKALDYIQNPEKTDGKMLVSSFGCSYETADIEFAFTLSQALDKGSNLAHHLIQAFEPGEVDYQTAHEIGRQLADAVTKGQHEYVLTTHIDKGHIVTSECKMDMEHKGVQSYQSQLYVRFLCFGNGALTALHDKSDGFFRRQIVLTTKDRPAGRADDPFLVDKLLREKEGIFLWCLEGLHRLIGNNYQFSISGKARENMETVKRSSNNVIEFLQSEGYIRFRADSEASSKAIYEAYTRWCDDNAQKPMSANRVSSELAQNERLYNVEATNNVRVGGKRVRGFMGIEVVNPLPY